MSRVISRREFTAGAAIATLGAMGALSGCGIAPLAGRTLSVAKALRVLGPLASLTSILASLGGGSPQISLQINYSNAGGCKDNFKAAEAEMRSRGIKQFSGVHRASSDHDFALLIGNASGDKGEGSLQYEGSPALSLRRLEPDVLRAALSFVAQQYNLSGRELARSVGVIDTLTVPYTHPDTEKTVVARGFRTACGGAIYYVEGPVRQFTAGLVGVHIPRLTDSYNVPLIGLEG